MTEDVVYQKQAKLYDEIGELEKDFENNPEKYFTGMCFITFKQEKTMRNLVKYKNKHKQNF